MQRSYIDYAMSVIVGRALPDVRDGLKPVHTRILYAMYDGGYRPDRGYSKCARVIGDVMGQYHPHGDSAIYDALVRLAQPWAMRMPLVDGQGNFGSPGNDPAAAYRYTECRLAPLAMEMLRDIDKDTVDFRPNYDGRSSEPVVLPGQVPQPAGQRLGRDRGRHGDQDPAAQPARGGGRRAVVPGQPRGHRRRTARGTARAGQGPRLPHPRPDRRAPGHRGGLPHRARLHHHARRGRGGGGQPRPRLPGGHRTPLPGQPGEPGRQDRRAGARRPGRRYRRHPRREQRPHRPAAGDHPQAGRGRQDRAEQPVQAHPAPGDVRREHAGARRRGAPHAPARPAHQALGDAPGQRDRPAHPVPAAPGPGAGAHRQRAAEGDRPDRRGDRADPRQRVRGGGAAGPAGPARHRRGAGPRHPRHAAAQARRPGAPAAHRRVRAPHGPDRRLRGDPRLAGAAAADHR